MQALRSTEADTRTRAFGLVVRAYRTPVMALLQRRWSLEPADAEDLAHDFFAAALEKEWFTRYASDRGKFRTFLRTCLFAFAASENDRNHSQKRGGAARHEVLRDDLTGTDQDDAMDVLFEQEWIRSVLQLSLESLQAEAQASAHEVHVQLFQRYDVEGSDLAVRPTYAQLGAEFGMPATQVTNHLAWARKRFRQHVLNTIRALTGSEQEYRAEVRTLLGIDVE
ncbi:MAG: sigma-70 family RNA polymerase sigma factor [Phycisphaerae bacterium]|nr:sigma-70 family RNA polymerase sigma factor [Gemmatimonadaceae bacterium]